MSFVAAELESQPDSWLRAAKLAHTPEVANALPPPDARVAIVGCGTSLYMAQSWAVLRENAGLGETDAFPASEFPHSRRYDHVVALTRSGTTTEVIRLLETLQRQNSTLLTPAVPRPAAHLAGATVALDFADEQSVVQTRFATTALALWRAHLGENLDAAVEDARRQLRRDLPDRLVACDQFTFLRSGGAGGRGNKAALKIRGGPAIS